MEDQPWENFQEVHILFPVMVRFMYTITSPYHPSDVAYFDGKTVKKVTNLNNDLLGNRNLGTVEDIWYKSSVDGRKIQGWIAKPPRLNFNKINQFGQY